MPEPKLPQDLNETKTFERLQRMSEEHCDAQIKRLEALRSIFQQEKLIEELNACINSIKLQKLILQSVFMKKHQSLLV